GTEATRSDSAGRTLRLGQGQEIIAANGGRPSGAQLPHPAGRVGQPGESDLRDQIGRRDADLPTGANTLASTSTGARTDRRVPSNRKLNWLPSLGKSVKYSPKPHGTSV